MLLLKRISCVDGQQRLNVQIVAPLEELQEAESVCQPVAPRASMPLPLGDIPDRRLPVEPLGDGISLEIIASGKSQKAWVQSREQLDKIAAVPVA